MGMKSFTLTASNIDSLIRTMKRDFKRSDYPSSLILPIGYSVLSNRYRGKGRPRKIDYDIVKYDWYKILEEIYMKE